MKLTMAKLICLIAHKGQKDKSGKPYWKHPFAVAKGVSGKDEKVVAYLHDVFEDTKFPKEIIKLMFGKEICSHVEAITRGNESYTDYIDRVKTDEVARKVKISDLLQNMNINRIDRPTDKDMKRLDKYVGAYEKLIH